jgi:hypothetical protein
MVNVIPLGQRPGKIQYVLDLSAGIGITAELQVIASNEAVNTD